MSFTKYIFICFVANICKIYFHSWGGNISYIRKHFEQQIVAIFCLYLLQCLTSHPRSGSSEAPLLLRHRDQRAFTEKWFSVTSIGPWEIMLSFNPRFDCVRVFCALTCICSTWQRFNIDLTIIWNVNYSYLTFFIWKQYYAGTALKFKILTFIEHWTAAADKNSISYFQKVLKLYTNGRQHGDWEINHVPPFYLCSWFNWCCPLLRNKRW